MSNVPDWATQTEAGYFMKLREDPEKGGWIASAPMFKEALEDVHASSATAASKIASS